MPSGLDNFRLFGDTYDVVYSTRDAFEGFLGRFRLAGG
jgi:hypothetical protein